MTEFTDYQISVDMAKQICMRDWRLELNSQSGFQGCVSTVFSIKWTILEVIVKNDKNSKGGRQQQRAKTPFFWRMLITILATQIREAKNELKTTIKVLSKFEKRS